MPTFPIAPIRQLDIGFDWDSCQKDPDFDGFCLTGPDGFDLNVASATPPQNVQGVDVGDIMEFMIYDISDAPAERFVSGFTICFRAGHHGNTSPVPSSITSDWVELPDDWYQLQSTFVGDKTAGTSRLFGGPYPAWPVVAQSRSPIRRQLKLQQKGWYFFSISITVMMADSPPKLFGNDPEMIVRPGG